MVKVAVLPGDGVGPEIIQAAKVVLKKVEQVFGIELQLKEGAFGGVGYETYGVPFPEETKIGRRKPGSPSRSCWRHSVGCLPRHLRPESALLALRKN